LDAARGCAVPAGGPDCGAQAGISAMSCADNGSAGAASNASTASRAPRDDIELLRL
jgi:hypothetical protein